MPGSHENTDLLEILKARFEKNMDRHEGLSWDEVRKKLEARPDRLSILATMERTGGEPDVVGQEGSSFVFVDCSKESPAGRRSVCYDGTARKGRKEHPPKTSALELATEMGATILNEQEYRRLQELGDFDTKTSSWVETPADIRERGGAVFCDRRYDTVFLYHNGADSYYAARGFRCSLKV